MTVFAYSRVPAFNPNTSPVSLARSAAGSVYDIGDTGFLTPLNLTLVATNTVTTTLISDANGMFPDFTLVDRVQCVFKSGSNTMVLTTSTPIPGPTGNPGNNGKSITGAAASAGNLVLTLSDATTLPPVPLPTGAAIDDSSAAYLVNNGTATKAALSATYAPQASPTFTGTVSGVTKTHVGLGNADNTSDANKPVSTAQATAIALKLDTTAAAATYATIAAVDTDLDAEVTRADSAYMAAPSTMYIPYDHSWWPSVGTEAEGFGPDSSGNPRRAWGLLLSGATPPDSLNNPGMHTRLKVPYGWNTVAVKIHYFATTTTGGNCAWTGGLYNMAEGSAPNAGSSIASTAVAVGTTAYVHKVCTTTTSLTVDYTKVQILHIYRNALSGTDTYNDSVMFTGVELTKVS